ncbi:chitinase [Shewanella psychrophila]|uniref:chitinase n=1 Tax=Shewanella psychrophila TaxID=225848 RepID=A0A1S6HUL8_9GAMM|nr:Ig-like domain-containing protein [Shewanella psychrophila]AQS39243.1 chitinase [Shewanella psychrophila]
MKNHISPLGAFRLKPLLYRSIIASSLLLPGISQAVDCNSLVLWSGDQAYNGDAQVQHLDIAYAANWWTKGNDPETRSGPYQEWSSLGTCDGGPTNTPPQVALTSPLNNASFSENDNAVINVNANDSDGTIVSVEYLVDGVSIGTSNQTPYSQNWAATIGNHEIKTIATDNLGASASAIVNISVASVGGNIPPSATQTSPTADSQITAGDITLLTADASDSDGAITQVDFYLDDALLATIASAPFEHSWTATEGLHSFKIKATDNDGAVTFSPAVQLNISSGQVGGGCAGVPAFVAGTSYQSGNEVENINHKYRCDVAGWCSSNAAWAYEPGVGNHWSDAWSDLGVCAIVPEVTITSPAGNTVVLANTSVDFKVDASDSDGNVTQVEFFAAGVSLGIDSTAPYSTSWTATNTGDIQLKAVATDNEANTAEDTLLVTVSNQPIVASISATNTNGTVTLGKTVNLSATASSVVGEITGIEFMVNGAALSSDSSEPYTASWTPGSIGNYTITAKATDSQGNNVTSPALSINVVSAPVGQTHKLIGYWHDFVNPAGCPMPLKEISSKWDVIDIAFADNDRNSNGTVHFNLYSGDIHSSCPALDASEFKQDMAALQAQGKIIVLSLGGAEGNITLNTDSDEANFVSSLTAIIAEWGFDGLDIDLESGSNLLHGTQIQARLPRALKQIETNMGGDMYLTMAPEHPYVQGGMVAYSGIWGAYIPLINELRDTLDLLHVQLYNNGGLSNPYTNGAAPEGSVDMMVASVKMLVEGFELADGSQFLPLRDDQVAIGLPSGPASANSGQAPTQNIIDALDCITKGVACSSVVPSQHFPNFGGVMTWSINWDKFDGYNFSGPIGDKIDAMNAEN